MSNQYSLESPTPFSEGDLAYLQVTTRSTITETGKNEGKKTWKYLFTLPGNQKLSRTVARALGAKGLTILLTADQEEELKVLKNLDNVECI